MKHITRKSTEHLRRNTVVSLARQLQSMAVEKGPDYKLPTTRELCVRFSTAPATLNDALALLEAQNVIYRKPRSGIFVSPKLHQKYVRILFNSRLIAQAGLSPFWGMLCGLTLSEAQKRSQENQSTYGFELITPEQLHEMAQTDELAQLYRDGQVHGILAMGMDMDAAMSEIDASVPLVTYAGAGYWEVGADGAHGVRLAVGALAEQGCLRIGLWNHLAGANEDTLDGDEWLPVLKDIFGDCGVPLDRNLVRQPRTYLEGNPRFPELTYQDQGYLAAMMTYTGNGVKPDGLYLADDMLAEGVLTAFDELGITPGVDVKIAATWNTGSPTLYGHEHALILVEYDPSRFVTQMFDVLDLLMAGNTPHERITRVKPALVMPGDNKRRREIKAMYGLPRAVVNAF